LVPVIRRDSRTDAARAGDVNFAVSARRRRRIDQAESRAARPEVHRRGSGGARRP
jgi:hypothetical protein